MRSNDGWLKKKNQKIVSLVKIKKKRITEYQPVRSQTAETQKKSELFQATKPPDEEWQGRNFQYSVQLIGYAGREYNKRK